MGLYMNAYAGAYLVLSDMTYKEDEPRSKIKRFCANESHGKQSGKFCSVCGEKILEKTHNYTVTKTHKREWYDFNQEFFNVAGFMDIADKCQLIPHDSKGSWEIDLPENFTERGGGGCIPAVKFDKAHEMETVFRRYFEEYIQTLIDEGFTVEVKVGMLIWWS